MPVGRGDSKSERAIAYARVLSVRLGASIHLVHVLDRLLSSEMAWAAPAREAAAYYERQYQEARAMLGSLAATLEKDHVSATAEARTGAAATEIIKAAVDYGADLIVMATHGRTGLSHLVLGSVAEHVIRHARCPVLAMRDNQSESGSVSAAEVADHLA